MCHKTDTKVNETESPPPQRSQPARVALYTAGEVMVNSFWELKQVIKHQLLNDSLSGFLKRFIFIFLQRRQILHWFTSGKECLLQRWKISTVQHDFNCVSAGRNRSRMIKTLVVISDLFQDTLNFLLLIGPSKSELGVKTLLAGTHFKHHLIAWCDNLLSDDPVLIHKHSHYHAQTGQNLAKPWWNRNKHNV